MTPDPIFAHPRLAEVYDALDPDRSDLDAYDGMADELGARSVLDVGCGTGTFALRLARRGLDVAGVDPAAASLAVARAKPGAERVRWIEGTVRDLPPDLAGRSDGDGGRDLAVMTGNVAQVFTTDGSWAATLTGIHAALRPGAHLVFESRVPEHRDWERWTPDATRTVADVPGVGRVEQVCRVLDVAEPPASLVRFRHTFAFAADGAVLTSDSTIRFRSRPELEASLAEGGFTVDDIRDAPDRPGLEMVFIARRL